MKGGFEVAEIANLPLHLMGITVAVITGIIMARRAAQLDAFRAYCGDC